MDKPDIYRQFKYYFRKQMCSHNPDLDCGMCAAAERHARDFFTGKVKEVENADGQAGK